MPCDDADDVFQQCSDDGFESNQIPDVDAVWEKKDYYKEHARN